MSRNRLIVVVILLLIACNVLYSNIRHHWPMPEESLSLVLKNGPALDRKIPLPDKTRESIMKENVLTPWGNDVFAVGKAAKWEAQFEDYGASLSDPACAVILEGYCMEFNDFLGERVKASRFLLLHVEMEIDDRNEHYFFLARVESDSDGSNAPTLIFPLKEAFLRQMRAQNASAVSVKQAWPLDSDQLIKVQKKGVIPLNYDIVEPQIGQMS